MPTLIARRRSRGIAARLQSRVRFDYTVEVLEELRNRGVVPTGETDPQLVRDFLSALYRFEIRRLKGRLLSGEFPQREYASRVRALRREYVLLSIPARDVDATGLMRKAGQRPGRFGPGPTLYESLAHQNGKGTSARPRSCQSA